MQVYDLALVDNYTGKVLATYKGGCKNLKDAKLALLGRSKQVVPPDELGALVERVSGHGNRFYKYLGEAMLHYGFAELSVSKIQNL